MHISNLTGLLCDKITVVVNLFFVNFSMERKLQ